MKHKLAAWQFEKLFFLSNKSYINLLTNILHCLTKDSGECRPFSQVFWACLRLSVLKSVYDFNRANCFNFSTSWILNNYWMRFCDIQNNQGRGKGYQLKPQAGVITLTEILIIFCISQKPNLITVLLYIERINKKRINDMINCDIECPWHVFCGYDVTGADFESPIRKETVSSMYNNRDN